MTPDLLSRVNRALPKKVSRIEFADPELVLGGDDWWVSFRSGYEVHTSGVAVSWEEDAVEDAARELVGSELISVSSEGLEPTFSFGDGRLVRVQSEPDDWEPWVANFPGLIVVGEARGD